MEGLLFQIKKKVCMKLKKMGLTFLSSKIIVYIYIQVKGSTFRNVFF